MATHNIDQFFKRKTSEHEVTPSQASWESLANQLESQNTDRKIPLFKIAAAVLLVLVSGFLVTRIYTPESGSAGTALIADHPVNLEENEIDWTIPEIEVKNKSQKVITKSKEPGHKVIKKAGTIEIQKFDTYSIAKIEKTSLRVNVPGINNDILNQPLMENKSDFDGISIKYIASEGETNKEENPIKKIFNYATSNNPVEIYSDIRNAKNNLLSRSLD